MADTDTSSSAYDAARRAARGWLEQHWDPSRTVRTWWVLLAESGWGFPTWPADWYGKAMSVNEAAGVRTAFVEVGALGPPAGLGQLLGAPTLLTHGTDDQKARFLPALARGDESWCQFFSEPGAGSDLAGAQTRAVAEPDGWTVDGQKVWTSGAQFADRGMLLARTNRDVPKHRGLSYFVIDVDQPGVDVRPLHQMNGAHGFNEVFFTDAQVAADRVIGEIGGGWSVALTTLMFERSMTALPSAMPGSKGGELDEPAGAVAARLASTPTRRRWAGSELVAAAARELGGAADPVTRQRLAALAGAERLFDRLSRARTDARTDTRPDARSGARGSLVKLARSELARSGRDTGMAVLGADGLLAEPKTPGGAEISHLALSSPGVSIAGGTDEVQRNIVGERVLGLPKELRADRDAPFRDLTIGTQR